MRVRGRSFPAPVDDTLAMGLNVDTITHSHWMLEEAAGTGEDHPSVSTETYMYGERGSVSERYICLLYTSDAADEMD